MKQAKMQFNMSGWMLSMRVADGVPSLYPVSLYPLPLASGVVAVKVNALLVSALGHCDAPP